MNATAEQHELEVYEDGPVPDVHQGRPQSPLYRERGELLMAQWSLEDAR